MLFVLLKRRAHTQRKSRQTIDPCGELICVVQASDDSEIAELHGKLGSTFSSSLDYSTTGYHCIPGNDLLIRVVVSLMLLLTPKDQPDYGLKSLLRLATCDHPALLITLECYPKCVPCIGLDVEAEISIFTSVACSASSNWTCRALALDILFTCITRYDATDRPSRKLELIIVRLTQALEETLFPRNKVNGQYATPLIYFNSALAVFGLLLVVQPEDNIITNSEFPLWLRTIQFASDDLSVS